MMDIQPELRSTKVTIGTDRLQIRTDLSDQELNEIVEYVSQKLERYSAEVPANEMRKRLILMSLDIASEYFDTRRRLLKLQKSNEKVEQEVGVLNTLIDGALTPKQEFGSF